MGCSGLCPPPPAGRKEHEDPGRWGPVLLWSWRASVSPLGANRAPPSGRSQTSAVPPLQLHPHPPPLESPATSALSWPRASALGHSAGRKRWSWPRARAWLRGLQLGLEEQGGAEPEPRDPLPWPWKTPAPSSWGGHECPAPSCSPQPWPRPAQTLPGPCQSPQGLWASLWAQGDAGSWGQGLPKLQLLESCYWMGPWGQCALHRGSCLLHCPRRGTSAAPARPLSQGCGLGAKEEGVCVCECMCVCMCMYTRIRM